MGSAIVEVVNQESDRFEGTVLELLRTNEAAPAAAMARLSLLYERIGKALAVKEEVPSDGSLSG